MAEPAQPTSPWRSRRTRWLLAIDMVLLAGLIAALAVRHFTPPLLPPRFAVVQAGRLYRSAQPTAGQLARAIQQYGIRTIVNLRNPDKDPQYVTDEAAARPLGARVVRLPISSTTPLDEQQLATLHGVYDDPGSYPILVHCEAGHARTGVAVAIWRIEKQGWKPEDAIKDIVAAGYPIRPENEEMRQVLLHWKGPDAPPPAAN
jgi:protein tyrosine/serine phosphatase